MSDPVSFLCARGLPELGIPPDSLVQVWPFEGRYGYYHERDESDHGVLLRAAEAGGLVPVVPAGPEALEMLRRAVPGRPGGALRPAAAPGSSRPARILRLVPRDEPPAPATPRRRSARPRKGENRGA